MTNNPSAAVLLGAAVHKIFPHAAILETGASPQGFFCEFRETSPFHENYLPMLEKAMKEMTKMEMQQREMMPTNAGQFFEHHKMPALAARAKSRNGTVGVVQIGEYFDLFEGELHKDLYFFLTAFDQTEGRVRIEGNAFATDRELKNFLKKFRIYSKKNHEILAQELDLFENETWHPRGMVLRRTILMRWREVLEKDGFEEVLTENPSLYFQQTGRSKIYFLTSTDDKIYSFNTNSLISCLQLIAHWVKIFDFDCQWILRGSRQKKKSELLERALHTAQIEFIRESAQSESPVLEVHLADALGRFWVGPKVEILKEGFSFSLFGDLERFIALVIEKYEGEFPFWLAPEQVRLIPFVGVDTVPAQQILRRHKIRFKVADDQEQLKEKIYQALRLKVPYVMVFGKQEESAGQIKIRAYGSNSDQIMTMMQLNQFLLERQFENQ